MAVTQEHFQSVGGEIGEIIPAQFLEGGDHGFRLAVGCRSECVGLVFVVARKQIGEDAQHQGQGRIEETEEYQSRVE